MEPIVESGMTFGPYPDEDCFHIEKSATYAEIQAGVRMAEFLLLRTAAGHPADLWIVEAKQSSPRPENRPKFVDYIAEICDKLSNALALGVAGGWSTRARMVRCANPLRTGLGVIKGSMPRPWVHGARTHHFTSGSLHAPYALLRNCA